MDLFLAPENSAFLWAITLMLIIAIFEGVAMLVGAGLGQIIDSMLPDVDIDAGDVDLNASPGLLSAVLGWLYIGKVPALVWLILFLTSFSLGGYLIQGLSHSLLGLYLPSLLAVPGALLISLLSVRLGGNGLSQLHLQDETEAISVESFVGAMVTIVIGEARRGLAAEAKFTDKFGTTHYVRVEPEDEETTFQAGDQVLLTRRVGSVFRVIKPGNSHLTEK